MKHYQIYWNSESWGGDCPPENWEGICSAANAMIDDYINNHKIDVDNLTGDEEAEFDSFLRELWDSYCSTDEICGVVSQWP